MCEYAGIAKLALPQSNYTIQIETITGNAIPHTYIANLVEFLAHHDTAHAIRLLGEF